MDRITTPPDVIHVHDRQVAALRHQVDNLRSDIEDARKLLQESHALVREVCAKLVAERARAEAAERERDGLRDYIIERVPCSCSRYADGRLASQCGRCATLANPADPSTRPTPAPPSPPAGEEVPS